MTRIHLAHPTARKTICGRETSITIWRASFEEWQRMGADTTSVLRARRCRQCMAAVKKESQSIGRPLDGER